ncbi:flagellar protein FlaG [Bacillus sp. FJAT-29790]|uniref:flagellar protein FlaG n=1 Tax=Bacillus sp. FJAT-29790 TaxID=1895002 RepID=UPI0020B3EE10|nr:flagellar protein FlaG [Bacillus sp. FJAT-29790]
MKINGMVSSTRPLDVNSSALKESVAKIVEVTTLKEQHQDKQLSIQNDIDKEKKKELTKDEAEQIVNGINEFLKPKFTSLNFKMHEELDRYYVEVIDKETKKVIREIPSKELLDMYAKMTDFLGLIIDKKF